MEHSVTHKVCGLMHNEIQYGAKVKSLREVESK